MTDGVGNLKWAACTDLKHWIPESRQSDETEGRTKAVVLIEVKSIAYTRMDNGRLEANDAGEQRGPDISRSPTKQSSWFCNDSRRCCIPGAKGQVRRNKGVSLLLLLLFPFCSFFPLPFRSCMNLRVIYQFPSDDGDALSSSMSSGGCC